MKTGHEPPDHSRLLLRLRRVQGQISGIEKMISERRYCVDILTQFRAAASALKAAEAAVFESHIRSCVAEAARSKKPAEIEKKIDELTRLLLKNG